MRSKSSEHQKAEETKLFGVPLDDVMSRSSETGLVPKFVEYALSDIETNRMVLTERTTLVQYRLIVCGRS